MRRKISIFGATGSIGRNTVSLVEDQGGAESYEVVALSGAQRVLRRSFPWLFPGFCPLRAVC